MFLVFDLQFGWLIFKTYLPGHIPSISNSPFRFVCEKNWCPQFLQGHQLKKSHRESQ